jgi:hypothetical protein
LCLDFQSPWIRQRGIIRNRFYLSTALQNFFRSNQLMSKHANCVCSFVLIQTHSGGEKLPNFIKFSGLTSPEQTKH